MPIIITSVYDVEDTIKNQDIDAVLSIEHPGAIDGKGRAPRLNGVIQKITCYWDTENVAVKQGPVMSDIIEAFDFLDAQKGKNILVHCKAGKRRSVAIVLGYLAREQGIESAIETVKHMRDIAAPNILIIKLIDDHLGFSGALYKAVDQDSDFRPRSEAIRERIRQHMRNGRKPAGLEMR